MKFLGFFVSITFSIDRVDIEGVVGQALELILKN